MKMVKNMGIYYELLVSKALSYCTC